MFLYWCYIIDTNRNKFFLGFKLNVSCFFIGGQAWHGYLEPENYCGANCFTISCFVFASQPASGWESRHAVVLWWWFFIWPFVTKNLPKKWLFPFIFHSCGWDGGPAIRSTVQWQMFGSSVSTLHHSCTGRGIAGVILGINDDEDRPNRDDCDHEEWTGESQ